LDINPPIYALVLLAVLFPVDTTYASSVLLTGSSFTAPELDDTVHHSAPHVIPPPTVCLTDTTRTSGPSSSSYPHTHTGTHISLPRLMTSRSRARAITQGGQYVTAPFQMFDLAIEYAGRNPNIKTDHKSSEKWQSSNIFE